MLAKVRIFHLLPALVLALGVSLSAQTGTLQGKVTGEDGKPVTSGMVKITRTDVPAEYETKLNKKKGTWLHAGLPLGVYTVALEIDGAVVDRVAGVKVGMGSENVDFDLAEVKARAAAAAKSDEPASEKVLKSMSPAERKQYEAELAKRQKAMAKNKELNETFNAGMTAKQAGDFPTAIEALTKATTIDPEQDVIWANLADTQSGFAKSQTGDAKQATLAAAAESYRKALALKPTDAAYHNNLGLALIQAGDMEGGKAELANAATMDPVNGGKYYFNLGAVMINSGNTEAAIEAFQKATEIDPNFANAYYQMGIAMSGKAQMNEDGSVVPPPGMIEALQKYVELEPTGPNAPAAEAMIQSMSAAVETEFVDPNSKKKKR